MFSFLGGTPDPDTLIVVDEDATKSKSWKSGNPFLASIIPEDPVLPVEGGHFLQGLEPDPRAAQRNREPTFKTCPKEMLRQMNATDHMTLSLLHGGSHVPLKSFHYNKDE